MDGCPFLPFLSHPLSGMAATLPRTLGELQLYRILQRANLLCYYDAFIQQGGDDVQQLCEAGEDEFLEIMALVGMASKPLHVRRLQKASPSCAAIAACARFAAGGSLASRCARCRAALDYGRQCGGQCQCG